MPKSWKQKSVERSYVKNYNLKKLEKEIAENNARKNNIENALPPPAILTFEEKVRAAKKALEELDKRSAAESVVTGFIAPTRKGWRAGHAVGMSDALEIVQAPLIDLFSSL